ncbi:MAG: lipoyl synthase [Desulfuromonadales bacterium C00003094]|nr:MAG: lipoyl synthase [Desulfuromonadales bacterium C00003094]OEU72602.1 MAG: lipoyl synthase [Desulfuromonadales bacterium C00003107]
MPLLYPRPNWLRAPVARGPRYRQILNYHRQGQLRSVCYDAACPNRGECWSRGIVTFMLLGNKCSRSCRFCNIGDGIPAPPDPTEAQRLAVAVAELGLQHAVFTAVTRDDLPDGGATQFVAVVRAVRQSSPTCRIELLISDLQHNWHALAAIIAAAPDVLGHNIETVPRLYSKVRPQANYQRSLQLLNEIHRQAPQLPTKSGLMLGLGERHEEVLPVLQDLRAAGVSLLTLGQYLPPSKNHQPVQRYLPPQEFVELAQAAKELGFAGVESGPLVRSSYHAAEQYEEGFHA